MDEDLTSSQDTSLTPSSLSSGESVDLSGLSRRRWWQKRRLRALLLVLASVAFLVWFVPPVHRLVDGSVKVTHWHRTKGEMELVVGPGTKTWMPLSQISKHALNAIVAAEDTRFYAHFGLDPIEIWNSLKTNIKRGHYARGGSTITQQVVKVAFLSRDKTLLRKMREAVGALILELLLPKQRILEWYINLVEFGDGVYGIKEGCWHYFKTKPSQLTIEQSIHLALVLPSPNKWSKGLRARELTDFGHSRFKYILNRMRQMGFVTDVQWRAALAKGDFGRPIKGYRELLAEKEKDRDKGFCVEGCDEEVEPWDEETDDLTFPAPNQSALEAQPIEPAPAETEAPQSQETTLDVPSSTTSPSESPTRGPLGKSP